jgi:hypothetical protein
VVGNFEVVVAVAGWAEGRRGEVEWIWMEDEVE